VANIKITFMEVEIEAAQMRPCAVVHIRGAVQLCMGWTYQRDVKREVNANVLSTSAASSSARV
jgi:hypothetical protein